MVTAAVTAGGPAIAATIADFAKDAHKVDGLHAVAADASAAQRAGKLVATDGDGRLPKGAMSMAPNAQKLDGRDSSYFATAAALAESTGSLNSLEGRPCTSDGQTGTTTLEFAAGAKHPDVTISCHGVVTPDSAEPGDNARETARRFMMGMASGTISPASDSDWITMSCDVGATNMVVSLNEGTTAVFDGYKNNQETASVVNQTSWTVGDLVEGDSFTIRVHGEEPDSYTATLSTYCGYF